MKDRAVLHHKMCCPHRLRVPSKATRKPSPAGSENMGHFAAISLSRWVLMIRNVMFSLPSTTRTPVNQLSPPGPFLFLFWFCPSFDRSYGRHAAHLSLSVFRLYGLKDPYDALSALLQKTSDAPIPAFDDRDAGVGHVCGLSACKALSESLLALPPPDACDDVARSGTGGGGASSNGSGSSGNGTGSRKSNRKRPESALPPRAGAGKRQRSAPARSRSAAPEKPQAPEPNTIDPKVAESTAAAETNGSEASDAGATSEAVAAAAWKFPGSRNTAVPSDVTASPSVASSPGGGYFAPATSAGSSSPSTAAVAAAAAAVASATATAVAAATSTAVTNPRSSDHHDLPSNAPGLNVERTGSASEVPVVSGDSGALWPSSTAWEDGGGTGIIGAAEQGSFLGCFNGMRNNNSANNRPSHAGQSDEQHFYLPPLGMLHAQSGSGNIAGVRRGDHNGGGGGSGVGAGFVSDSSHYATTQCRHGPRDVINEPLILLGKPGTENFPHALQRRDSQQRRIEGAPQRRIEGEIAVTGGYEPGFGGGSGGGSWPVQGSDAAATTTAAGRTMAWTDPNAREVMPAWFGGGSDTGGAGPITLPPLDRGFNRDCRGGGDWRQHNISVAATGAAAVAGVQQLPPRSDGGLLGGRVAGAGKVVGSRHVRVPSFRAGGAPLAIGTNPPFAHVRRASGRGANGNEFDFVYELGMLLDEEEFPGGQQPGGR